MEKLEQQAWIKEAVTYAKTTVELVFAGRDWKNKENKKWIENIKGRVWILEGTPAKGFVMLDDGTKGLLPDEAICFDSKILTVTSLDINKNTIIEFVYPDNPMKKYKEWYRNSFKREDLDTKVSEMIHSNIETEEIVLVVIDTIFSDIENNPKKKISVLREEYKC